MISNCGHDERGKYSGGAAGDQTGTEWAVIKWYSRPWKCVLRHPDAKVRGMVAQMARAAAGNDKVGYDQSQRYTFWEHLKASKYDPAKITVKCEADCSSGVAAIVKAVGYRLGIQKLKDVSIYCYTGNLRAALKAAGFEVLTDKKYLASDDYLLEGDVLLNDGAHTAINVTDGSAAGTTVAASNGMEITVKVDAAKKFDRSLADTYKVTASALNLRAGAGTGKAVLTEMPKGLEAKCYGYYTDVSGTKWLYVEVTVAGKGYTGFASSKYLVRSK
jgi:hypothetical protein